MTKPHLIGIAGASCSGKTTLASHLVGELSADGAVCIVLDSYYYDLSDRSPDEIDGYNLDEPAALESDLLIRHMQALAGGRAIDKPVYDHKTHTRAARSERVEPVPFVFIEGLFTLYWPDLRDALGTAVFIDATHDVCLRRRIERDRNQRGRTREEVTRRYNTMVAPMYDRHVLPTREFADLILDGTLPTIEAATQVIDHIRSGA
jgi:uridine kinase